MGSRNSGVWLLAAAMLWGAGGAAAEESSAAGGRAGRSRPAAPSPADVALEALADYVIGPGDILEIEVFELEELSQTVRVTGDGKITFPMLGEVEVQGLTKRKLEDKLARRLEERYVRDPQVTVFLKEMQSGKVSVLGAVQQPGGFGLVGSKTLLDALSQAGGVTRDAGTRAFLIRRGEKEPVVVNLKRLMEDADLSLNLNVAPGDFIYVPKSKLYKVFVYGQVERPGAFDVEEGEGITVLQAVAMAGGLARRAAASKTKIVRSSDSAERETLKINLERIIAGKDPDLVLEKGDIVVVPKSFF